MNWIDFTISAGFSALFLAVKNKELQEKFKAAFLKIYRAIKVAYPEDTAKIDSESI